ncbi:MAG: threonine synthase, partial [Microbacterium gubbeenense]
MQYISTRGGMEPTAFCETLLEGLAPDGGLAVPAELPSVDEATLESWRSLDYADLATEVLGLFATDIPRDELV